MLWTSWLTIGPPGGIKHSLCSEVLMFFIMIIATAKDLDRQALLFSSHYSLQNRAFPQQKLMSSYFVKFITFGEHLNHFVMSSILFFFLPMLQITVFCMAVYKYPQLAMHSISDHHITQLWPKFPWSVLLGQQRFPISLVSEIPFLPHYHTQGWWLG